MVMRLTRPVDPTLAVSVSLNYLANNAWLAAVG
jgi:hypothetical protein